MSVVFLFEENKRFITMKYDVARIVICLFVNEIQLKFVLQSIVSKLVFNNTSVISLDSLTEGT